MLAAVQTVSAVLIGQMSGSLFAGLVARKDRMSVSRRSRSLLKVRRSYGMKQP